MEKCTVLIGYSYAYPECIFDSDEIIQDLLFFLPNQERKVVAMYIQGYTTSEISMQLKLEDSSVRVYRYRAQRRLRKYMEAIKKTRDD